LLFSTTGTAAALLHGSTIPINFRIPIDASTALRNETTIRHKSNKAVDVVDYAFLDEVSWFISDKFKISSSACKGHE